MPTLTKVTCQNISKDVLAALATVEKAYGIKFAMKGGKFTQTSVTLKLEASVKSTGGIVETPERTAYGTYAVMDGLPKDGLDKVFEVSGRKFQIIGYRTRARKNPVLAKCLTDGKNYCFPVAHVKLYLAA